MKGVGAILFVLACIYVQTFAVYCPPTGYLKYSGKAISTEITPAYSFKDYSLKTCRSNLFLVRGVTYAWFGGTDIASGTGSCKLYTGAFDEDSLTPDSSGIVGVTCTAEPGVCGSEGSLLLQGVGFLGSARGEILGEADNNLPGVETACREFSKGDAYSVTVTRVTAACFGYDGKFNGAKLIPRNYSWVMEPCRACRAGLKVHVGTHYDAPRLRLPIIGGNSLDGSFGSLVDSSLGALDNQIFTHCDGLYHGHVWDLIASDVDYTCRRIDQNALHPQSLVPDFASYTVIRCDPGCSFNGFKEYRGKRIQARVKKSENILVNTITQVGTSVTQSFCETYLKANQALFYTLERKNENEKRCVIYLTTAFKESYLEDSDDEDDLAGVYCPSSYYT